MLHIKWPSPDMFRESWMFLMIKIFDKFKRMNGHWEFVLFSGRHIYVFQFRLVPNWRSYLERFAEIDKDYWRILVHGFLL
jgi:hypothetical protein